MQDSLGRCCGQRVYTKTHTLLQLLRDSMASWIDMHACIELTHMMRHENIMKKFQFDLFHSMQLYHTVIVRRRLNT